MENCDRFIDMISRKLDGDLTATETFELNAHLENCPSCASVQSAFEAISMDLSEQLPAPEGLSEAVMSKISAPKKVISFKKMSFIGLAACLAFAIGINADRFTTNTEESSSESTAQIAKTTADEGFEFAAGAPDLAVEAPEMAEFSVDDDEVTFEGELDKEAESDDIRTIAPAEEGDPSLYVDSFLSAAKDTLELNVTVHSEESILKISDQEEIKLILTSLSFREVLNISDLMNPDYTLDIPERGIIEIWKVTEDGELRCKFDDVIFTPVATADELEALLFDVK